MSSTVQIVIGILLFVIAFILSQIITGRRIRSAGMRIVRELSEKRAYDVFSAVEPGFARSELIPRGLRDFRPRALEYLIRADIVGLSGSGKIYLKHPVHAAGLDFSPESRASKTSERR